MRRKREDYPMRVYLLQTAMELYLVHGFTLTTNRMLANKANCSTGQITNFFRSKENILCEIIKQVLPFHQGTLAKGMPDDAPPAFRYCIELAVELAMCERNEAVRDLYINAYTLPQPLRLIREYSAKKSIDLFSERLPDWTEQDFYDTESITQGIVFGGGLIEKCSPQYPFMKKAKRVLDALLKMYEYPSKEREAIIEDILGRDIEARAVEAETRIRSQVEESIHENAALLK